MSAISFSGNYVSSSYYAAAKRQSAAVTETNNNSNLETSSSAGDVLTISEEALEILNKNGGVLTLSVEELEAMEEARNIKSEELTPPKKHLTTDEWQPKTREDYQKIYESFLARAFGINVTEDDAEINLAFDCIGTTSTMNKMIPLSYTKYQNDLEDADETFAELLKKNGIQLNKDEHIELTIDYDGNVTVSGNISKEKSEQIQNALNNDKSLGINLLSAHANRKFFETKGSLGFGGVKPAFSFDERQRLLTTIILQREYGVSLADFEINLNNDLCVADQLNVKNGNNALLSSLIEDDPLLVGEIFDALLAQERSQDTAPLKSVTFSYQNDVFIEEGANYAKSLSSFTSDALRHGGVLAEIIGIRVDYHVTFDKDGQITDAEHTNSKSNSKSKSRVLPTNKTLFNKLTWHGNNLINLKLKQYAFDKNRLTQHETGEESAFDTFTIGKDEKGSFSIAVNSNALYNIAKSQSTT